MKGKTSSFVWLEYHFLIYIFVFGFSFGIKSLKLFEITFYLVRKADIIAFLHQKLTLTRLKTVKESEKYQKL